MNNRFRVLLVPVACCGFTFAADGVIQSRWANSDPRLDTNPISSFWRRSEPTYMESDALGKPEPKCRTEIRTRWTKQNLYFLFAVPTKNRIVSLLRQPTAFGVRAESRSMESAIPHHLQCPRIRPPTDGR